MKALTMQSMCVMPEKTWVFDEESSSLGHSSLKKKYKQKMQGQNLTKGLSTPSHFKNVFEIKYFMFVLLVLSTPSNPPAQQF